MECDVYNTRKSKTCIFVAHGANVSSLPAEIHTQLGPLTMWKTVSTGPTMIAADPQKIEAEIASQGYSIASWQITTTVSTQPLNPRA